jgi:hypothetical protein
VASVLWRLASNAGAINARPKIVVDEWLDMVGTTRSVRRARDCPPNAMSALSCLPPC